MQVVKRFPILMNSRSAYKLFSWLHRKDRQEYAHALIITLEEKAGIWNAPSAPKFGGLFTSTRGK